MQNEPVSANVEPHLDFEQVIPLYQDRIYNTVYRILNNAEEASDITQETFLKAFRARARFRGDSTAYTWLYRIAVNTALSHRKRREKAYAVQFANPDSDSDRNSDEIAVDDCRPPDSINEREKISLVKEAITELEPDLCSVVVLCDVERFSYEEAASILKCAVGTIKSRLHRGRLKLRERLRRFVEEA